MELALRRSASLLPSALTIGAIATAGGGFALLSSTSSYDVWGGVLIAPIIVAVAWPLLARAAVREGDHRLLWFWLAALAAKFGASVVRLLLITDVYSRGDALSYHAAGRDIARSLRGLDPSALGARAGTESLEVVTGAVYAVTGPTLLGGFLVFASLAFVGQFLWFRAVRVAVPSASPWPVAIGMFVLPSLLFWPSSIGKESWMMLALGLGALGAAHLLTGAVARGAVLLATGCAAAAIVRPHFALLLASATTVAWAVRRPAGSTSPASPVLRLIGVLVLLGLTLTFFTRTGTYFGERNVGDGSVISVLEGRRIAPR